LFGILSKREGASLAPAFTPLLGALDRAAKAAVLDRLDPLMPSLPAERRSWFEPHIPHNAAKSPDHYRRIGRNLQKTMLYDSGLMPLGMLRDCLDLAL